MVQNELDQHAGETLPVQAEVHLDIPEPSGVVWCETSGTLYVVSDRSPLAYEISEQGRRLNQLRFDGRNIEGVSFDTQRDLIWIAQEEPRRLIGILRSGGESLRYGVRVPDSLPQKGLEGVVHVASQDSLYAVNERAPVMLIKIDNRGEVVHTVEVPFAPDLSGICAAPEDNGLLLLSDMAASIYWTGFDGSLKRWWKLPVKKPEGISLDNRKKRIFVVSDSEEKLFVFPFPACLKSPGSSE